MEDISRRQFIIKGAVAGAALTSFSAFSNLTSAGFETELVAVKNGSAAAMVRKAVEELGGMARFVRKGQTVLLKPNIGWDRLPEQAANTNPEAVGEMVKMCLEAGASRVRVLDRTCNQPQRCYTRSGIEKAAKDAGAEVRHIIESRFQMVQIPDGQIVKSWPFYKDVLESDVFINMPIAKDHSISRVTLGFKNIMGLLGGDRGDLHNKFMTKIVDINLAIKPSLTIIDAYRILLKNGPSGGNLADVAETKTMIAGTDRVAVDAYAATLFDVDSKELEYLKIAEDRGLGKRDLAKVKTKEITLSA